MRPLKRIPNHCWKTWTKKVFKGNSKRPKLKVHIFPFQFKFFENFCIFIILRYDFLIEISISELFGHLNFWPLCYCLQNAFLTDLAWQPLLRPYWGWGKILGYDFNSLGSRMNLWPYLVTIKVISEEAPGFHTFSTFCFPTLYWYRTKESPDRFDKA